MEVLAETFRAFVARHFGAAGREWLERLPQVVDDLCAAWDLDLGDELAGGKFSYVAAATTGGGVEVVLKVGPPWRRALDELDALTAWAGRGAPAVVRMDRDRSAVLLERIRPGTRPTDTAAAAVADVLRVLHVEPPRGLPVLGEIVRRRLENAVVEQRTSADHAAAARSKVERLERVAPAAALLHGDFDDRNLLVCEWRGLAAIDPLPCARDPAYDAAYWAHAARRAGVRERRRAIAEAYGVDARRVRLLGEVIAVHG